MKRTGAILLAVVIGTLQWAGTMLAQNAGQQSDLQTENAKLKAQVIKLKEVLAQVKAEAAKAERQAKEAMARADKMAAEAAKQKQQMMAVFQQLMVRRGGIAGGFAPAVIKNQLVKSPAKQPVQVVRGSITKIDPKDKTLVELNIGSKNGIKLGQSLSVVRRNPQPVYVGDVRIVDLQAKSALARFVVLPGRRVRALQTGDVVTNEPKSVKSK